MGSLSGRESRVLRSSEAVAAAALRRFGFRNVRLIPAVAASRTADLVGECSGARYAIEVRTATRRLRPDASFKPPHGGRPLPYPMLEDYFALLWREKRGQLEASLIAERCDRGLLLVVAEGEEGPLWASALARAWNAAGSPETTVFAVYCSSRLTTAPSLKAGA